MKAIVAMLVLVTTAHAEPVREIGFRYGGGDLPIAGRDVAVRSLELGVEHRVWHDWRIVGDFAWLWLGGDDMPALAGDGQRLELGVRHRLGEHRFASWLSAFADADAGGGVAATSDDLDGVHVTPLAYAGVRVGYAVAFDRRTWEVELLARAVALEHGHAWTFAVGMTWGN